MPAASLVGAADLGGAAGGEDLSRGDVVGDEFFAKVGECPGGDVAADFSHEA